MSLIKNLVKESEKKAVRPKEDTDSDGNQKPRPIIKSALDLQRLKLEKLMKNPEKPVVIPEHRREKDYMQSVPTFVRNVMGSSAGAGSGEFHVYRHLRRKEYARQKMIQHKSIQEQMDEEYQNKLEEHRRISEEKTAKKRAKRLKKKNRTKKPRKQKTTVESADASVENASSESDNNEEGCVSGIKEEHDIDVAACESNSIDAPKRQDGNTKLSFEAKSQDDLKLIDDNICNVPSGKTLSERNITDDEKTIFAQKETIIENETKLVEYNTQ